MKPQGTFLGATCRKSKCFFTGVGEEGEVKVAVLPEMEVRSCWKRPSTPRSTRSFSRVAALDEG